MNLYEIAFSSYLYRSLTDDDASYVSFCEMTDDKLNLDAADHRQILVGWLNQWGCRQFSVEHHGKGCDEILAWHRKYRDMLIGEEIELIDLTDADLDQAAEIYDDLMNRVASYKHSAEGAHEVRIGPTGAAKILFAVRPRVFAPWDAYIREKMGYESDKAAYKKFISDTKDIALELKRSCESSGVDFAALTKIVSARQTTIPKLIDEYHWVTQTKNVRIPPESMLMQWLEWNK